MVETVTISVSSDREFENRIKTAFAGVPQGNHISFPSEEMLWRTLTAKRWQIVKAIAGRGPLAIREVARKVGRDVKAVHADVTALVSAGLLERSEAGVVFPYDEIHVDFVIRAA